MTVSFASRSAVLESAAVTLRINPLQFARFTALRLSVARNCSSVIRARSAKFGARVAGRGWKAGPERHHRQDVKLRVT